MHKSFASKQYDSKQHRVIVDAPTDSNDNSEWENKETKYITSKCPISGTHNYGE